MNQPVPWWFAAVVMPIGAIIIGAGIACWVKMIEMLHRMGKGGNRENKD